MVLLGLVIYGIICASFTSTVMKSKGYKPTSWAWGGFFFGIIALIAAIGMPLKEDSHSNL